MENAFQAAVEIGIPIINCGPGGKSNDESTFQPAVDSLGTPDHFSVTLDGIGGLILKWKCTNPRATGTVYQISRSIQPVALWIRSCPSPTSMAAMRSASRKSSERM